MYESDDANEAADFTAIGGPEEGRREGRGSVVRSLGEDEVGVTSVSQEETGCPHGMFP